jgi:hypothetical protein
MNDVILDLKILVQKVRGTPSIRKNAAYFRSGDKNVLWPTLGVKLTHSAAVEQIQLPSGADYEILEPLPGQFAAD